jgi:DNA-binding transcriptional regulator GbsR (MarR family)
MKVILNNPYRTVGLLVGATAREQERQVRRLKQFLEAEQDPQDDFSFPTLGNLHRTLDKVNEAASKLNLDSDKMSSALFWFYKGNPITDEPAFDAIKEADLDQVISIWTKLTSNGEVSQRNASAYSNLGTLYLSGILEGTNTNEALLEQGISLKLKFLESDFIKDFKALATDETYKTTKKELQLLFLNQVQSEIEKSGGITSNKFLDILTKQEFSAKEDFLKGFVQKPIEQIEKKIEEAKAKRKANKANAVNVGKALYEQTSENLKQLKSILGTSNLKFSSISDKVSDEILQCGIDYFSHYKDSSTDPGSASMDLFRKAKTLAVGNIAKQRCSENTENLQEWMDDKPERDKQARILADFEKLKNLIDEYESRSETVANGKQLLASARPYLSNVKSVLGSTDELYLGLSSRIASDAQGMCVSEINKLQERFANTYDNATKVAAILLLKERVNEAWDVTTTIGSMDLRQDFRTRYTQNRTSLSNLKTQLAAVNSGGGRSSGGSSGSSGCYIATMAYGDYDHPQVMILRQFRDEVLDKSALGKWFIKTYYHYSPKLVERLKNKRTLNSIIRKALNQFIKLIK